MRIHFGVLCWLLAKIKRLFLWLPFMNKSFVIVSSGRSGSTLLVQLLNCHPNIRCKGELLNRSTLKRHDMVGEGNRILIDYILASLLLWAPPWIPYTAFKVFNEQLQYCHLRLKEVILALSNPPVIVLYRKNMLETFVSLQIAFRNNIWYSETVTNSDSIVVNWEQFAEYVDTERNRWKMSMSDLSGQTRKLFISYEELTSRQTDSMNKIFMFLGLDSCLVIVQADSKRQNPLSLPKKVKNYQQIAQEVMKDEANYTITSEWLQRCCCRL